MRITWPGFSEYGTLLISIDPIPFQLVDTPFEIYGNRFIAKNEMHITVLGSAVSHQLQLKIRQDNTNSVCISETIKTIFETIDWTYELTDELHLLSRISRSKVQQSIVQLVELPGISAFYQRLYSSVIIDEKTPVPPPHITLYTHNCPLGIGISSDKILKEYDISILNINELYKLMKASHTVSETD